jgi:hypothetical protein
MAMFMAFLMFSSSIGLSMDIHFCGDELKSFSFLGEAEPCDMMKVKQEVKSTHSCCESVNQVVEICHNEETLKGQCCHNESLLIENGGGIESNEVSIVQLQHVLITSIIFVPNFHLVENLCEKVKYTHYNPPPLIADVSILNQVFLI